MPPLAVAQQQAMEMRQGGNTPAAKPPEVKVSKEDRAQATQLLEVSEAQSRSFEAPLRSYMLYQIAQAQSQLDKAKARTLYCDAFTSTLEMQGDDDLKQRIQNSILTGLLTVSQSDVEELLQQAEPPARKKASEAIARRYLDTKKYDRAVGLVESMTAWTEFPYDLGSQIMAALPEQRSGDFRNLFTEAFSSYQSHAHKDVMLGSGDFPGMVSRFGNRLPPRMALDAIDEILKQSKEQDKASITLSGEGGTASFGSVYEYELFQLLPLLRKYDEGQAKKLLDDDSAARALAQQYPNGVQSLDPGSANSGKPAGGDTGGNAPQRSGLSIGISTNDSGRKGPSAADQLSMELGRRAEQIARDSEHDPMQAIAEAAVLPNIPEFSPRARALQGIAQANIKKNPMAAKQALDELRKVLPDLRPENQARYLVGAAKAYLEMDDSSDAQKTLDDGFKLCDKLLVSDKDADDPNRALKAYWPSVENYRQFLEIESKLSRPDALSKLDDIQDPEMQTIERVMFSSVLLGKPMKQSVVSQKKKNSNFMMTSDSD